MSLAILGDDRARYDKAVDLFHKTGGMLLAAASLGCNLQWVTACLATLSKLCMRFYKAVDLFHKTGVMLLAPAAST
jgi:hypothetical protein